MAEKQWEIDLQQIRQLMRNEITNHDRIKDRIVHLRDLYAEGQVNDCAISWESWAVSYFANSRENLRRLLGQHPNTVDAAAKRQQKLDESEHRHQDRLADEERKQRQALETAAAKQKTADVKKQVQKKPPPKKPEQLELPPPHELMVPLLNAAGVIERKSRIEMGEIFSNARKLVDAKQVGRDPATGKYWRWTVYGPRYFKQTYRNIHGCIKEWEENVKLFHISEDANTADNVTPFPKTVA
jgi:hypothetical protein